MNIIVEKIKFMPLFSGLKVSIGGEWREQYQNYTHANFGQMPASYTEESPHQWLHRWLVHADLQVNSRFRIFTQLNNTVRFWNPNPILSQVEQNMLSIHQIFGEYKFHQNLSPQDHLQQVFHSLMLLKKLSSHPLHSLNVESQGCEHH